MIGAIVGDIIGSVHEFKHPATKQKDFGPLFINDKHHRLLHHSQYTDDSVLTLAVGRWLLDREAGTAQDPAHYIRKFGLDYKNKGYGTRFNMWLYDKDAGPYNSWGNGAPMRCSYTGYIGKTLEEAFELAEASANPTHNHPEAVKAAKFTAGFIYLVRDGKTKEEAIEYLLGELDDDGYYKYIIDQSLDEIRPSYRFEVSSKKSMPQAVLCVLEGNNFEDVIRNAISLGGDADTLAAIAGSMAEPIYPIPDFMIKEVMERLDPKLRKIMIEFVTFIKDNR